MLKAVAERNYGISEERATAGRLLPMFIFVSTVNTSIATMKSSLMTKMLLTPGTWGKADSAWMQNRLYKILLRCREIITPDTKASPRLVVPAWRAAIYSDVGHIPFPTTRT